jgi:putative oxidoreductase
MKPLYPILMALLGAALGAFFIYKGVDKHFISPCKVYGPESTLPQDYINLMTTLCSSGFTKVVGSLEVFAGILLVFPRTRLLGSIILLPVISTIFLFHLLIDNRPDELVETGVPLAAAVLMLIYHYKDWRFMLHGRR